MTAPSLDAPVLSSKWDGLSPHLLAHFFEVDNDNGAWKRTSKTDPATVVAPLTEASMEASLNWQSPFEQSGPESKAPALMAMLQSGVLQPIVEAASMGGTGADGAAAQKKSGDFLKQFEGRTGITLLNSTQVFNGMQPVKFQVVAVFRAWSDPVKEVEEPVAKLMEWALPAELSKDGSVLARLAKTVKGDMAYVEALMPSRAPVRIAMQYKGRTYFPLVIENIGQPLNAPVDRSGRFVEQLIPMTLCTLTALDRGIWANFKTAAL
ncbi:hypothetical protein [Zoogloea oleivorans]|uniref:hypothetical protein n=1 Tax=Zoogloea oleivorans TaxID=1552750 RepID=UPI001CA33F58|nr:hypothetical protein [Zoogloea oleivorans]